MQRGRALADLRLDPRFVDRQDLAASGDDRPATMVIVTALPFSQ